MSLKRGLLARALERPVAELSKRELQPINVGVLDSGIDGSHPDLRGRVIRAIAFEADAEGNVGSRAADPAANNDLYGHGTGVASIISRIAPNARFIDIRVLGGNNRGSGEALMAGFEHAVKSEAQLLNMSLAASEKFLPRMNALSETAYRRGMVIVASRRNMPLQDEGYPAALIPCVGVDNCGPGPEGVWRYRMEIIEYAAHGVDVPVAAHGGGYTTMTGTSFATPIMAGFVALLLGAHPGLRPFEVKAILKALAAEEAEERSEQ
jgi:subtilisin family serine protease